MKQNTSSLEKPKLPEILVFSSGDAALNITYTMFSSFVLYFYTDTIGLNAALVGMVILISRIFDGISDIIAGDIIDRTHSKDGHCIPWLRRLCIPYGVSLVLAFLLPDSSVAVRIIYIFVTYNLFNTVMYTMTCIAQGTLPAFVTDDQNTRSTMVVIKMIFSCVTQIVVANITLPAVEAFGGGQSAWIKISIIYAIVSVVIMFVESRVVKERIKESAETGKKDTVGILRGLKACFQNKYWLMCLGLMVTGTAQLLFTTTISTYYFNAVYQNANLVGPFVLAVNAPGIFVGFVMPSIIKKMGKRNLAIIGTLFQIAGELIFCFGPSTSAFVLWGSAVIRGIGFGAIFPLGQAMCIDTIEYGEWKTGIRTQALLISANSVAQKVANGVGTSVFGAFITAIAYDGSKAVQSASTISSLDMMFKWFPMIVYAFQLVLLLFYHLDKEYPQIMEDLKKRKAQAA